jgi:hypothetical protein
VFLLPWIPSKNIRANGKPIGAANQWQATPRSEDFAGTDSRMILGESARQRNRIKHL